MGNEFVLEEHDGAAVLRISGKLDAGLGERVVAEAEAHPDARLVLDLAFVEYLSSSGLAALIKLATERGARVAGPSEAVRTVIEIAGLGTVFHIHESVEEALAAADGG